MLLRFPHRFDRPSFHPEMVFLANLGVNLHVCLCGDHRSPPRKRLISIRKWSFWPISASICTFACAATCRSPPHKRLISLILAKNPHFRIGN
ncbi:hypothetical protein TRIP_B40010 [uncultured Desulfatiglans sp.]|nr:hypothetical protein TRIP_B40010 [uncultured Desulfatiglans sp.]